MATIAQDYKTNQIAFTECALKHGGSLYHIPHPADQTLTTDIAILGNPSAKSAVIITSGLHGVELPAGSAVQQLLLEKLTEHHLANTCYIFVHALNPYGAFHALRTDLGEGGERNIDPARNFIDFATFSTQHFVANADIAKAFETANLSNPSLTMMWARLLYTAFVRQGQTEFKRQFVRGQYSNPMLPYYGGHAASYTRRTWEKIVQDEIVGHGFETITHFDIHTGDGPFGGLQLYLCNDAGDRTKQLAEKLIAADKVKTTDDYFAEVIGDVGDYWKAFDLPDTTKIYPITMEFGTTQAHIPGIDILGAILNRTLLAEKYNDDHPQKNDIIRKMRTAFTPTQDEWATAVLTQSAEVWDKFLAKTL